MKTKTTLIAFALITTLISSPQAFPAGKTSLVVKDAARSSKSIPNTILSGNVIPLKTVGIDGDFYIDLKNANLYGPKTKGVWKLATSLRVPETKDVVVPVAGIDGAKGNTGEQGLSGANGTDGAAGAKGADGVKGADGAKGATGLTGATGSTGYTGATGSIGATGAKGETGATGLAGTAGTNGTAGVKGDTGTAGTNGVDGSKGDTGLAGAKGDAGIQGVKGDTGLTGSSGSQGATGSAGAAGISSAQWVVLSSKALVTTSGGRSIDIISTASLSADSSYTFEVMVNGLVPVGNTEDLFIGGTISVCTAGDCVPITNQYCIASNSESYANGIKSKHFGIRIMGAYTNASGTPFFGVNINIQTASLLSSISFSGTALITKVGSIG
ncbi:Collagen repeat-containing protein [Candidatus Planktophila vernalis]|uniref:Collagen repeat-containing protein n=1 Tax=Candidatus Planktophila vernalis TaxID=1884907 RepID=A0A249KTV7_9ACTN|nr:collagen-like protein [Candidatus Planktophila vernalis]ASY20248.1 Collagen repeat-containing protein [Candidatus Planktophila vernalis]